MSEIIKVTAPRVGEGKDPNDFRDNPKFIESLEKELCQSTKKQFSLDRFSLNGQAAKMEAAMADEKYVLGHMALLGQSTLFYAKPNAGKTLLVIWLLIEKIKAGDINGEDVFYINADDTYSGMVRKLKLAERHGFQMLAPDHNGFKAADLATYLFQMIKSDTARGKILILDTVKKFTDLMNKKTSSGFGESVRRFVSHGGTVISLAHVNKHRDGDQKVVYSGTTDLVDDADCAYTLDTVTEDSGLRTVRFENFKARGDVANEAVFRYNCADGTSYQGRLDSIRSVTDTERKEAERQRDMNKRYQDNSEAIHALREALQDGVCKKTDLITAAMKNTGLSRKQITRALRDHTGTSAQDYQYWTVRRTEHNAHEYRLNSAPGGVGVEN